MSRAKLVELFYDVVSPYTWFAFETLCRYRGHWNMELKLRPFFLGGIMTGSGNQPPAVIPNKAAYMVKDLERLGKYFDVPHRQPANPWEVMVTKGTLKTQRFVTAVDMKHPEYTEDLSRAFFQRIYTEDVDVTEPQSLREGAENAKVPKDVIEEALASYQKQEVKDRLKAVTQEALDLGAFGSPFMVVHIGGKKEIFFGSDRFPVLAMVMGEKWKGPLPDKASKL